MTNIAICAPASPITPEDAARVTALAAAHFPQVRLHIHPQCYASDGHFAGDDQTRLAAFLDCANDPGMDAVWFARGGYGSNRIAEAAVSALTSDAADKIYLGYSDMGYLLAALYRHTVGCPAHGPLLADINREGGEEAILRALGFLCGQAGGLEPSLTPGQPAVAYNLTTLAMLVGTPLMPDLAGHVVMVEEVAEHLYAIDRLFFHIAAQLGHIAGLRLGRVSAIPENDRPFGQTPEQIARHWCRINGIAFLGGADIGHDAANRIVPFGVAQ